MKIMRVFFIAALIAAMTTAAVAQATGDYGSATTGSWSAAGSWLIFNTASDWSDATAAGSAPTSSNNVFIRTGHIITFDAATASCNNLTISGTLNTSKTLSVAITVNGDITVNSGGAFIAQTNSTGGSGLAHTLNLQGSLTHNGTTLDFRNGTSGTTLSVINLTLSGTTNSTVTVNGTYSASNGDFNAITINKTGGAKVILGSDVIMSGGSSTGLAACYTILTFTSGIVETGSHTLICQTTTAANVTGYSSTSYVNGALGRGMSSSAGATQSFPVGDANGYRIVSLRSTTSGTATGHYAIVRCTYADANNGSSTFAGGIDKVSQIRYYQIGYNKTTAGAANMSFDRLNVSYGAGDGVSTLSPNNDIRIAYSTDGRATWTGLSQTTAPNTSITDPPTQITPDAIGTPVSISAGSNTLFFVLARASGTTTNTLPVELASFTATGTHNGASLVWKTATETNNFGFNIERRVIGSTTWSKVGFVAGHGTSATEHTYNFADAVSAGTYAYRIAQVDNDGSVKTYNESQVTVGAAAKTMSLSNYPNPFNPTTTFEFSVPTDGMTTVKVYNVLGQEVVMAFSGEAKAGQFNHASFDGSKFSSGVYFYAIENNGQRLVKKMLMMK